ncbi:hypothetical protein C0991_012010 [Blastosporella zonata]|nr:hypothetical protein C0991_012010 [Blastosporella zonata]
MVSFKSLIALCSAAVAVMAAPAANATAGHDLARRHLTLTSSTTGTLNSMFYSLYMEDSSSGTSMTNYGGTYSLTWTSDVVDVVAGVGWNPGSAQAITYSGSFSTAGNAYLSVYGWTTSPLVEYYIVESYGDYNPSTGATQLGTVTSDGGTYDIYKLVRTNAPSIQGTATFNQYWSVRTSKRVGGTVTTSNHFNAWSSLGLSMGTFNYQILATEGYESSGTSTITVNQ